MSLFNMCCPKKPKMTLDYVIKWIEETDKTVKDLSAWVSNAKAEDLKPIFDEYAATYPWDQVPEFDAKVDKVENPTEGNFAALNGEGNITDSEYKASDFAPASHYHTLLRVASQREPSEYNYISLDEQNYQGRINIRLYDSSIDDAVFSDPITITAEMLTDVFYPIVTPPASGSRKLITSGAVYTALQGKADKVTGATDGNLAGLDEYGNLTDSGKKASDFAANDHNHNSEYAPKNHTHTIYDVENLGDFYKNMAARVEAIEGQKTTSWTTIATIGPANVYDEHNLYGFDGIQSLEVGQRIRLVNHYNSSVVLDGSIVGVGGAPYRVNVTAVINISGGDYDLQVASFS